MDNSDYNTRYITFNNQVMIDLHSQPLSLKNLVSTILDLWLDEAKISNLRKIW